jgi:hypothetical protein
MTWSVCNAMCHQVVDAAILDIVSVLDCEPVQAEWDSLVQDGLCSEMFDGFYEIWRALYFCTAFMLALCVTVSLLYQYFGVSADTSEGDERRHSSNGQADPKSGGVELSYPHIYGEEPRVGRSESKFRASKHDDSVGERVKSMSSSSSGGGGYRQAPSSEASAPPEAFMIV